MSEQYKFKKLGIDPIRLSRALKNREIWVEEFEDEDLFDFDYLLFRIEQLDRKLNVKPKPITIKISSYGGNAHNCFSMISLVKEMQNKGYFFYSKIMGKAMSAGFFLGLCADHRIAQRYSELLCHDGRQFQYGIATHIDTKRSYEESQKLTDMLAKYTSEHSKITIKEFMEYVECRKDWTMNAEEALSLGVIDEIL